MEKRDGTWRIARRKMLVDYTRLDPASDKVPVGGIGGATRDLGEPSDALRLRS